LTCDDCKRPSADELEREEWMAWAGLCYGCWLKRYEVVCGKQYPRTVDVVEAE
jgi:hypothetical protein